MLTKKEKMHAKWHDALPEEFYEHAKAARREIHKSFESLFPPEFAEHRKAARMIGKQKKLLVSLAKRNARLQKDNNLLQNKLAKDRNKCENTEKREKDIIKMQIELINKDGEIKALKWALQNLRN